MINPDEGVTCEDEVYYMNHSTFVGCYTGSIALDEAGKYHDSCSNTTHECSFAKPPTVPVISHETGNYK